MKRFTFTFDNKKYTANYITDKGEAVKVARRLQESPVQNYGIDIETYKRYDHPKAGLEPHLSGISLVQLYGGEDVWIFDALQVGLDWLELLRNKNFVAHYGIFEIKHLTHNGLPNLNIGCSMLLSILVDRAERSPFNPDDNEEEDEDEPSTWKGYGLDAIIGRLFDLRIDKKFQTHAWHERPVSSEALVYAALDAILTFKICEVQIKKVNEYKMVKHYKLLKDMQHVIADMELAGMYIDKDAHMKLIEHWKEEQENTHLECIQYFADTNLNSSKQLEKWAKNKFNAEALENWVKTKKGALGFGKDALASMQHLPEIKALLKHKKTAKLLSTYGTTLEAQINPVTQRVHCSFSLGETRTGRLSSRDPNLQNLPRDSSMRNIFTAEGNKKLIVADFNQIELRVAGEVSKDPVILSAYKNGDDLHSIFASKMFGIPVKKVTKEQRQIAKSANFGAIYGMGPSKFITYTLASTGGALKLSFEQAKHTIDTLWDLYKVYGGWCKKVRHEAEVIGFIRTPLGKMRKLHPQEVYTKAPNTVVQGGAFEVMAVTMVELRRLLQDEEAKIINSVHDEVIVECSEEDAVSIKQCIEACMMWGMKQVFPRATTNGLAVAHICNSWGEGKG